MIKKISVKTELGWVSAFENKEKIFKIKFGKVKKQSQSQILKKFKKNYWNLSSHGNNRSTTH